MRFLSLLIGVAVMAAPGGASAQLAFQEANLPATSLGMAGTGRSYGGGSSALYLNPATLAVARQYVLGGGYNFIKLGDAENHAFKIEWIDSMPNGFNLSMGVAYDFAPHDTNDSHGLNLALAYTISAGNVGVVVGAGGHRIYNAGGSNSDVWSADLGAVITLSGSLMIGIAGYNLVGDSGDLDYPRGVGGGISYWTGPLMIAFDASGELQPEGGVDEATNWSYMGGLQYQVAGTIFARAGIDYNATSSITRVAGGLSIISGRQFGIHVGYQQNVEDGSDLTVGIAFHIYNPFGSVQ